MNKNGKVVYFDRKKPLHNSIVQSDEKEMSNIQNITKQAKSTKKQQSVGKLNTQPVNVNGDTKIKDDLVLESSAYTLRSVVDTVVKDDDIEYLAKMIDKNKKPKTIKDFDLPEYYFDSNTSQKSKTDKSGKQVIEINGSGVNNTKLQAQNQSKKKESSFTKFAKNIKNKVTGKSSDKTSNENEVDNTIDPLVAATASVSSNRSKSMDAIKGNSSDAGNKNSVSTTAALNNKTNIVDTGDTHKISYSSGSQFGRNMNTGVSLKSSSSRNTNQAKTNMVTTASGTYVAVSSNEVDERLKVVDSNSKKTTTTKTTTSLANTTKSSTSTTTNGSNYLKQGKYYIQLGSFVDRAKANELSSRFRNVGDGGAVVPTNTKNGLMYKVVIGEFSTKDSAEKEMEKVLETGHFDCYVFKR